MNRSKTLFYAILQSLKSNGKDFDGNDDLVFYRMQQAQDAIFSEIKPEKTFSLITQANVEKYSLRSGFNFGTNLHVDSNAASLDNENNSVNGWSVSGGSLSAVSTPRTGSKNDYAIRYIVVSSFDGNIIYSFLPKSNYYQYINIWVRASKACQISIWLGNSGDQVSQNIIFDVTTGWTNISGYLYLVGSANQLQIYTNLDQAGDWLEFDDALFTSESENLASRNVIDEVKRVYPPSSWKYEFQYMNNNDFRDIQNSITTITQPLFFTIFGQELKLYPVPLIANEELKIDTRLRGSETKISFDNDPELDPSWDQAIEEFVLQYYIPEGKHGEKYYAILKDKSSSGLIKRPLGKVKMPISFNK